MSDSTAPPPSDEVRAAFKLALQALKERRHLAFDELADVLSSHGYSISGELPYIYRQNRCLVAWLGMSTLFYLVAERLRRHPHVRIERAVDLSPSQYPPDLQLPIARVDMGPLTEPHWLPCEFVWRGGA